VVNPSDDALAVRNSISRSSSLVDLRYFLVLALRSCRRERFLTISIMLTLGVGFAAVFSILHVLSGDPIPSSRSAVSPREASCVD
jgi:hypothetical protein